MAYYSSSNYDYDQYNDNYHYYQPYNYDQPHESESRYVHHQYYSDHTQYYGSAYQQLPTESLVGYHYSTYNNNNNNNNNYTNQLDLFASKNATFHENDDYYYDPVSTQFVISYSTADTKVKDLEFEEYHVEPYHGGYDIYQTYGKALPPSDDICYPPTKVPTNSNPPLVLDNSLNSKGAPSPHGKESPNLEGEANLNPNPNPIPANVIIPVAAEAAQVEDILDSEEDEDYDDDDDEEDEEDYDDEEENEEEEDEKIVQNLEGEAKPGNVIQEANVSKIKDNQVQEQEQEEEQIRGENGDDQARNGGDNVKEIRRQIPAGYGLEAVDICDGIFGGYFPCLLKRNYKGKACDTCGGEVKKKIDDYECWQGTVDYLFGNPNPYGGTMPEKGSYGDPVYSYQRHQPQQSISGQVQYEENSSWLHSSSSRYNYGHNYGDYEY